jgi:hypothetical protein
VESFAPRLKPSHLGFAPNLGADGICEAVTGEMAIKTPEKGKCAKRSQSIKNFSQLLPETIRNPCVYYVGML